MSSETACYNCSTNILLSQDPQDKSKSNPIVITITAMDPSENKDYLNIIVFVKDMEAPTFTSCDTTKTTVVSTECDYGMNTTRLYFCAVGIGSDFVLLRRNDVDRQTQEGDKCIENEVFFHG